MAHSMAMSLVGEHLPVESRSGAIGHIYGWPPVLSIITGLIVGIVTRWGWRFGYLGYVFPISLLSLAAAIIGIPSDASQEFELEETRYVEAFKVVRFKSNLEMKTSPLYLFPPP